MNKRTGNPLHRRYLRELRGEFGKYAVIFVLLVFTIGLISGFLVADGSMITAYNESFEKYRTAISVQTRRFQNPKGGISRITGSRFMIIFI